MIKLSKRITRPTKNGFGPGMAIKIVGSQFEAYRESRKFAFAKMTNKPQIRIIPNSLSNQERHSLVFLPITPAIVLIRDRKFLMKLNRSPSIGYFVAMVINGWHESSFTRKIRMLYPSNVRTIQCTYRPLVSGLQPRFANMDSITCNSVNQVSALFDNSKENPGVVNSIH